MAKKLRVLLLPACIAIAAAFVSIPFARSVSADRTTTRRLGSAPLSLVHGRNTAPFSALAGNWSGTWTDTRYNVSGTLAASFTVIGSTVNATGVIGLQSLGLGNEAGTGVGTVSGDTLNFTFTAATVGNGSGTLNTAGAGSGTGSVTGTLNFGGFTYSGTMAGDSISGNFAFTSLTGGHGVASLTKH